MLVQQTPQVGGLRIAGTVQRQRQISQGKAAEIAGLSLADFIEALSRFQVCPFQYTTAELEAELQDAD